MNIRSLQFPVRFFLPLFVILVAGCFSASKTAEQINTSRLLVAEAKDKQANVYAEADFELAARHCGRSEQAFWSGYNHKGFDLARMCEADAIVAIERSRLAIAEANQSRVREEVSALERELAPFISKEEILRETIIIREKSAE